MYRQKGAEAIFTQQGRLRLYLNRRDTEAVIIEKVGRGCIIEKWFRGCIL
jgi:hypothetical protein